MTPYAFAHPQGAARRQWALQMLLQHGQMAFWDLKHCTKWEIDHLSDAIAACLKIGAIAVVGKEGRSNVYGIVQRNTAKPRVYTYSKSEKEADNFNNE